MTPAGIRWPAVIDGWPENLFQTKLTTRDLVKVIRWFTLENLTKLLFQKCVPNWEAFASVGIQKVVLSFKDPCTRATQISKNVKEIVAPHK